MEHVAEVCVRRARPSDVEQIAVFINQARPGGEEITPAEVLDRLGTVGFLLAEADAELVGLLGWGVENLVARMTDFLIYPARFRQAAGGALLAAMEDTADELQCEAVVLFVPSGAPAEVLAFWEDFGYGFRNIAELPRSWREVAREANPTGDQVMLKQIRANRVMRPM